MHGEASERDGSADCRGVELGDDRVDDAGGELDRVLRWCGEQAEQTGTGRGVDGVGHELAVEEQTRGPTPDTESVQRPDRSGVNLVLMRAEKSPGTTPGAGAPNHTAVVSGTVSRCSGAPSGSPAAK